MSGERDVVRTRAALRQLRALSPDEQRSLTVPRVRFTPPCERCGLPLLTGENGRCPRCDPAQRGWLR